MATNTTAKKTTATKTKPPTKEASTEIVAEVVAPREVLTKKDIIARAVEISGVKKKDARPSVEAALQVVLSSLADGTEVSVPPYGKIRIVKEKDIKGGKMITAKIRVTSGAGSIPVAAPLAEAEE
jgi:nucleoid DNA-binding protein